MPLEKDNQYMDSDKMPYIFYGDTESLIKKIDGCANNPENSSTTRISESIPCGYSMSTIWAFDHIENKHTLYCGKDRMKMFFVTKNIINFQEKKNVTENRIKMEKYVIFVEEES